MAPGNLSSFSENKEIFGGKVRSDPNVIIIQLFSDCTDLNELGPDQQYCLNHACFICVANQMVSNPSTVKYYFLLMFTYVK
jgi:hypothetical protein